LKEAAGLGFKQAIIPKANQPRQEIENMTITAVNSLEEAINRAF
jgi:DNA repair protein RadA/Sms